MSCFYIPLTHCHIMPCLSNDSNLFITS